MNISNLPLDGKNKLYSRSNPFKAKVKEKFLLTKPGSTKTTYHICLDLEESDLHFKVGDSIGVFAQNDPLLVEHLINACKASGLETVVDPRSQEQITFREFLTFKANLSRLNSSFLKFLYAHPMPQAHLARLHTLLQDENKQLLSEYLLSHDPLDILKECALPKLPLQELCAQFSPLLPRFYSVASSLQAFPNEVSLTVALFTYSHSGEKRYGVASHFLCHLCKENITDVPIYVQPARCFTLPEDSNAPIIMIGPGTGIAPFRGFLQERVFLEAEGKNWLFFGERNQHCDFFYEDFLTELVKQGKLKLDVAFSRDGRQKMYVQHKMQEKASELWNWLEEGAYLYVCGDAEKMAKDVERTLLSIFSEHGGLSEAEAKQYLKTMRAEKRYLLDVY